MTRTVGTLVRSEFVLDPEQALRLGRAVDGMLASARLPMQHGVTRATHQAMNKMDDLRQLAAARRLNSQS